MISIYCWNKADQKGLWLEPDALRARKEELLSATEVVWIDLHDPKPEEEKEVFETFFPIHALSLEDVTKLRREATHVPHFPKVEEFADYLFVIVNPIDPHYLADRNDLPQHKGPLRASTQLSAVLTERMLITHHYEALASIDELRSYLSRHEAQAQRGPDYLFHLVLDAIVDRYAPALDHVDQALEDHEKRILAHPTKKLFGRLLHVKRQIIALRKTMVYEREVLARLARGEFTLIDEREMVYYRNVYDHLVRFTELIEASREMVSDLMHTQLAAVSNRVNEVMKALATISTIVMPMTLIAGIYGMNFEQNVWPDFHESAWGFPWALGMMALLGLSSYLFFRWKKWS